MSFVIKEIDSNLSDSITIQINKFICVLNEDRDWKRGMIKNYPILTIVPLTNKTNTWGKEIACDSRAKADFYITFETLQNITNEKGLLDLVKLGVEHSINHVFKSLTLDIVRKLSCSFWSKIKSSKNHGAKILCNLESRDIKDFIEKIDNVILELDLNEDYHIIFNSSIIKPKIIRENYLFKENKFKGIEYSRLWLDKDLKSIGVIIIKKRKLFDENSLILSTWLDTWKGNKNIGLQTNARIPLMEPINSSVIFVNGPKVVL